MPAAAAAAAVGDSDTGVRWGKVGREGLWGSLGMKADRKKRPQKVFCYRAEGRLRKLGLEEQKERWRSAGSLILIPVRSGFRVSWW